MLAPHCICSRIPQLTSRAHFLVLRHAKERWRSTNTARIAALALSDTQIVDYGLAGQPPLDHTALASGAYLLFPGPSPTAPPIPRDMGPVQIVVPDGNWHQAGRLARRLLRSPGVQCFAISNTKRAAHTLRRTKDDRRLSTIEAMAAALDWIGEPENADSLRQIYRRMVEASVAGRGGRNRSLLGEPEGED